jgi:hypothetical protein
MPLSQASGMLDAWDGDSIVLDGDAGWLFSQLLLCFPIGMLRYVNVKLQCN